MSTEAVEKEVKKESEALFSKRRSGLVKDPLSDDNPVTVQVLGICSALAVTVQMKPTLIMALSVTVVIMFSNVIISLIRNLIPGRIRIIVQLGVIATLVACVDMVLKAYVYDVWKMLSVFIGLIITNCIVMGRLEAYAMGNKSWDSALDGIGNGFGYSWVIVLVSVFRELFGGGSIMTGTPLEFSLEKHLTFGDKLNAAGEVVLNKAGEAVQLNLYDFGYTNNGLMVSPVGAFFILAIIIWVQRARNGYVED
jgi:Na+-transporting NADH:ubiquinone oxidoreductase subunit D